MGVDSMKWPQTIYCAFLLYDFMDELLHHGEDKKPRKYNAVTGGMAVLFVFGLLFWGGFFR